MTLFFISFFAGALTVLAPCILPLLPVVIGGAASDTRSRLKPYVIIASLAISIIVFTLVLKASTALIDVPPFVWSWISGGILIVFGVTMLFPTLWEKFSARFSFAAGSNKLLTKGAQKKSFFGDVLMGAALGPVFSSCSPTYFVILATVLPESFFQGLLYLIAYALGLSMMLLPIAILGRKFVSRLAGVADPRGWFKRSLGALFLLLGLAVLSGADKVFESWLLDQGVYDNIGGIEENLLKRTE